MKLWNSEYVFEFPWCSVANAAWKKYPNPMNGAVSGIDVLDQAVLPDGTIRSERVIQTQFPIPSWATKLTGFSGTQYTYETSTVDPSNETMTLISRNLNGSHFLRVDEKLIYKRHPEDPERTILQQEAAVAVSLPAFTDYCEKAFLNIYQSNAEKGRKGVEWVIEQCSEFSSKVSLGVHDISNNVLGSLNPKQ